MDGCHRWIVYVQRILRNGSTTTQGKVNVASTSIRGHHSVHITLLDELDNLDGEALIRQRYDRFRDLGRFEIV